MTDETILAIAREVGWNTEHKASNDYLIKFARALMEHNKRAALDKFADDIWEQATTPTPEKNNAVRKTFFERYLGRARDIGDRNES